MELLISLLMAGFLVNCLIDVIQIFMERKELEPIRLLDNETNI